MWLRSPRKDKIQGGDSFYQGDGHQDVSTAFVFLNKVDILLYISGRKDSAVSFYRVKMIAIAIEITPAEGVQIRRAQRDRRGFQSVGWLNSGVFFDRIYSWNI